MNLINYRSVFAALALSCLPLLTQASQTHDTLIAVASASNNVNANISAVVAQASHFLLFDHNGRFLKAIQAQKPIANKLVQQGVTVVVAQKFNRQQLDKLTAEGIIPIHKKGQAAQVVQEFLQCDDADKKQ